MENDSAYVREEDDTGGSRVYHVCVQCPRHEKCSIQSFKRAAIWSYLDEDTCREKLIHHLMTSSLHYLSKDDATEVAKEAEFDVLEETEDDRAQYRRSIDQQKKEAEERRDNERERTYERRDTERERMSEGSKGKGKKGKRKSEDDLYREVKRLKDLVQAISNDDRQGGYPSASSHDTAPPQRGCGAGPIGSRQDGVRSDALAVIPTVSGGQAITVQKIMMVIDSMERAKNSAQSLQRMAHTLTKTLQERANAAMETSTQMADEIQVLVIGKQLLSEFVLNLQQHGVNV